MLKHLELSNFRNYDKFSLDFAKTTILVGPNGIGKTNILEAIYMITLGRSWRARRDSEVIRWGQDIARIVANFTGENENESLEFIIQRTPSKEYPHQKIIKINEVPKKLTDLLGWKMMVLFSPEEIDLVQGSPALRRRFLDILLCQLEKKYTVALFDLANIIRGRNKLLYFIKIGRARLDELEFWDEKLVTLGSFLIKKRLKLIEDINSLLKDTYREISGFNEALAVKYKASVEAEKFSEAVVAFREREIENTATLLGPHRDDFIFLLNGRDLSTFGSRGEFRSAVLALKITELSIIEKLKDQVPLLLLDDIFSELDKYRREHLAGIVGKQQTIITTTDLDHIEKNLREKSKVISLEMIPQ